MPRKIALGKGAQKGAEREAGGIPGDRADVREWRGRERGDHEQI